MNWKKYPYLILFYITVGLIYYLFPKEGIYFVFSENKKGRSFASVNTKSSKTKIGQEKDISGKFRYNHISQLKQQMKPNISLAQGARNIFSQEEIVLDEKTVVAQGEYKLVSNYYALVANEENKRLHPNAQKYLGHLIIMDEDIPANALRLFQSSKNDKIGIFTGTLIVRQRPGTSNNLALSKLRPYRSHVNINLYLYSFNSLEMALNTQNLVKNHPDVESVSLEILDRHFIER